MLYMQSGFYILFSTILMGFLMSINKIFSFVLSAIIFLVNYAL